ncbi:hypothetical protein IC757_09695 [Wenzhouxiangella sp. AB-CW3]|uniref:hypothetical protein n=1 Tax=Wenzhouxiangella sp. AB-CW3 TaxID=2771012 RepID=UPI00168B1E65|nr:hypothetical protein [Wenzhouxiangella sp. AB-CW3]QOC21328.1 hypothetical protein IC757_09695 [Wenzhouxiangella sp. AB-CW3]
MMKKHCRPRYALPLAPALLLAAAFLMPAVASAGNNSVSCDASEQFCISSWTIAGGGTLESESSNGQWQLSGTIGQWEATEARALSGGAWRLTGGFWGYTLEELAEILFQDRFEASSDNN